jgi:L-lactate dehydrogenase complex protein LldG
MPAAPHKRFLGTVATALGRPARPAPSFESVFPDERSAARTVLVQAGHRRRRPQRLRLLDLLIARAAPLNIQVRALPDRAAVTAAVVALTQTSTPEWGLDKSVAAWSHPLLASLGLGAALSAIGVPLAVVAARDRRRTRQQVIQSYVGITAADYCVADTATLVLKTRPGEARCVSLVPSIHVAVIELAQIILDLEELYARLKDDLLRRGEGLGRCTTFISGPSKTADIELNMVHGAHGPRALHILVITGGDGA